MENVDYKAVVKAEVFSDETFLKLTLSKPLGGKGGGEDAPWVKVSVRPVAVRGRRVLQFSYFDEKKHITHNYSGDEAGLKLDEALALPFGQIHVQATTGDLQMLVSGRGAVHISRSRPSRSEEAPVLEHNRAKEQPLAEDARDPFLRAVGIVNKRGKFRAVMRPKFRQINEFLRILDDTLPAEFAGEGAGGGAEPVGAKAGAGGRPLEIVDCGCGSAHLTFAAYHYLNQRRRIPAHAVGVDVNAELIEKTSQLRDSLGWDGLEFHVSSIADFRPAAPPDVVLSLHACDTATDEALAQGVRWGSRVILAAPCCQHELHDVLDSEPLRPLLRHGILRERLADIATDAFRALALRIAGYRTSVIEFTSAESTSKNLMIRAELGPEPRLEPGEADFVKEYKALKAFWGVAPAIERFLGADFERWLHE